MERVLVVGSSGAGKSTLAQRIGKILDLPVIHLDALFWKAGWIASSADELRAKMDAALSGPRWIIDGNYSATLEYRIRAADTVILLDTPRWLCMWRVLARQWIYRNRSRPDIAEGCPEKIDFEFLKWTWDYPERSRPKVVRILSSHAREKKIIVLRWPSEVERFVRKLKDSCR